MAPDPRPVLPVLPGIADELRPVVAVHQPNFFPWLGYFHKVRWSDTFVLLDDAQLQRRSGGTVTNRAELVSNGKKTVFTAPLDRSAGSTLVIDAVRFAPDADFRERLVRLVSHSYAKAPFFRELSGELFALIRTPAAGLAAYNGAVIRRVSELLGLPARIVASSGFGVATTSTSRLVDLVTAVSGRTYVAGSGAQAYQDDALFTERGLSVIHREYAAPAYPRGRDAPITGLSVLDALFLLGPRETRRLLDAPLNPAHAAAIDGEPLGLRHLANPAPTSNQRPISSRS